MKWPDARVLFCELNWCRKLDEVVELRFEVASCKMKMKKGSGFRNIVAYSNSAKQLSLLIIGW
jgi:hypothetical protein